MGNPEVKRTRYWGLVLSELFFSSLLETIPRQNVLYPAAACDNLPCGCREQELP
jgi:hypothetical protein